VSKILYHWWGLGNAKAKIWWLQCQRQLCTFSLLMVARGLSFQSTRSRYSSIRHCVVRWSPCALGTRTRTLCSLLYVVDNLSCGVRSWHAFEKNLGLSLVDLRRFRTLPFLRSVRLFHSLFTYPQQISHLCVKAPRSWLSVYTRYPNLLNLYFAPWHFRIDRVARDEYWRGFLVHIFCPCDWHFLTVQRLCQSWPEIFVDQTISLI